MSFRTLRNAGGITATQTADDAAHETDIGKLSPAASFRVTEYAGQDVLFLISDDYTAATSSNGFYLKASTSVTVRPSTKSFSVADAPVALNGTDSDSSNVGDGMPALPNNAGSGVTGDVLVTNGTSVGTIIIKFRKVSGYDNIT